MPRTQKKPQKVVTSVSPAPAPPPVNGTVGDVLTLAEAAAYLRVPVSEMAALIEGQGLPARRVGEDWRILKAAIQDWLRTAPAPRSSKQALLDMAGAFKDDPYLDEIVNEAYRRRGRTITEGGE
jgi:excisionase family DNA binding protein